MQIKMSVTNRSEQGQTVSTAKSDRDVVIVKMNMPHRFNITPGKESHRDLNTTKRSLRDRALVFNNSDRDEMTRNTTENAFATVTVNLLSRPKYQDGEEQPHSDEDITNGETNDGVKMPDDEEDNSEKDDNKDHENIEETESDSDNEDGSMQRTKTPLSSIRNVTLTPLVLPNIALACPKCSTYVNICHLRSHRDFHAALQTFKFDQHYIPQNLKTLIKRRKTLIKKLQETSRQTNGNGFSDKNLQRINTAFEILKSELEGTGDTFRILETELHPEIKRVVSLEMCCTRAVGLCEESNSRWKHMEDTHAYQNQFLDDPECCFVGIYDGYCGKVTAQKCAKYLHVFLKEELEQQGKVRLLKEGISTAFKKAYHKFQGMLLKTTEDEELSRSRWSGCSALTCLLMSDSCCLANAGNVGALLVRDNGLVKVLASRHDLYNKKERDRVRKCKGVIVKTEKCALINGALGTTRGLGNIGDMGLNQCIKNDPKFKQVQLVDSDQVIVLASSGLWKMFSYEEVSHLIFGFFRKIKHDIITRIAYGEAIPRLQDDGHLTNDLDDIYERLDSRHDYYKTFVRPKTSSQHSNISVGFRLYSMYTIEEEKEKTTVRVSLKVPRWTKKLGRRMSDTCLSYQGDGNSNNKDVQQDNDDEYEELPSKRYLKRRHSMPHPSGLFTLQQLTKIDFKSTQKDKENLLAKYLSRRLVKSSILAGSLDNITVFAILLQGFSLVNVHLVTEDLLEKLDD